MGTKCPQFEPARARRRPGRDREDATPPQAQCPAARFYRCHAANVGHDSAGVNTGGERRRKETKRTECPFGRGEGVAGRTPPLSSRPRGGRQVDFGDATSRLSSRSGAASLRSIPFSRAPPPPFHRKSGRISPAPNRRRLEAPRSSPGRHDEPSRQDDSPSRLVARAKPRSIRKFADHPSSPCRCLPSRSSALSTDKFRGPSCSIVASSCEIRAEDVEASGFRRRRSERRRAPSSARRLEARLLIRRPFRR